jgi:hypothetical protein
MISTFLDETNMEFKFNKSIRHILPTTTCSKATDIVLKTLDITNGDNVTNIRRRTSINVVSDFPWLKSALDLKVIFITYANLLTDIVKGHSSQHFKARKLFGVFGERVSKHRWSVHVKMVAHRIGKIIPGMS